MKRIIGIILLLAFMNAVCAETALGAEWNKTFGGTGTDGLVSVQQTSNGDYILAGCTDSYGAGGFDFWLVKTDFNGNKQWNKTYGGTNRDEADSVQQTSDGGYILTGKTSSYGAGLSDFWLVKTDSDGNKEWDKTYGGTNSDEADSVQQTSDGGYILAGLTTSYGAGLSDFWLVKTDPDGNKEWDKTFGGSSYECAQSVQQTSDGDYILAGFTTSYGAGKDDFWLVKTDSSGNEVWNKTFGGTNDDYAHSVQQTIDGGYILAGYTYSYGGGFYDAWLVKTDPDGNKEWDKTFGGSSYECAQSVQQTSDGGYILAGYTDSYGGGSYDIWLVKTDPDGNKEWDKTFGGSSYECAQSVQQTSDGGYILAGYTDSYGGGSYDAWLIKVGGVYTPTPTSTSTPTGCIRVWPSPSWADIYLDGVYQGMTGSDWFWIHDVSTGSHAIRLEKSGYEDYTETVYISAGDTVAVSAYLTATLTTGSISVSSAPSGSDIYLDGTYKGTTPTTISDVSPGSHALKLEKYGYAEWLTSVYITSGVTESITAHLTAADISPPAIRIDKPATIEQNNNGLLEEGEKVTITYGANDPGGVASIKILLDGTTLESQNRAGTYTVTTSPLTVGMHTIRVEATDSKSNSGFEELPITVERTGPSVYFGTTRTAIKKGEDAIFTLSAVNPIGNPSMTAQLILKPPSGVSVTSSSFAKAGSGIYTCAQTIESGDNVRSIEVHLTGNQIGMHKIASEVYHQFEGSPKSPTRYETLTLVVEPGYAPAPTDTTTETEVKMEIPGFDSIYALCMLLFIGYYRRGGTHG